MKKTIAISAPTGMLGSMVYNIFKDKYNLVLIYRDKDKLKKLDEVYGGVSKHQKVQYNFFDLYQDYDNMRSESITFKRIEKLTKEIGKIDGFINCAGIIIPHSLISPLNTFFINSALPHILSTVYRDKLIQVATDCVFDGVNGAPYNENSQKSPTDLYGLTKSLGEPSDKSLVLRTSIIGPEISGSTSLLEWIKSQDRKKVDGYTNHIWNGLTTKHLALVFMQIFDNRSNFPSTGLFHIFSTPISKYDLLNKIKDKYNLSIDIKPKEVKMIDRRLATIHELNKKLNIPSLDKMLEAL